MYVQLSWILTKYIIIGYTVEEGENYKATNAKYIRWPMCKKYWHKNSKHSDGEYDEADTQTCEIWRPKKKS